MFVIEDERHAEVQGTYATEAEALAELKRRSRVPWSEAPNRAPCMNWANCGRSYELVEYDDGNPSHWRELSRDMVLEITAVGRQILGIFPSKPSFRTASKGNHDLKGCLAYDFERIVG